MTTLDTVAILKELYPDHKIKASWFGSVRLIHPHYQWLCLNKSHVGWGGPMKDCPHPECVCQYVLLE